jgi:acyl-CoA synthetase (NDP forming)
MRCRRSASRATRPDVTGQVLSQPDLFERALRIIGRDPATTSLIVQLANRGPHDALRYQRVIAETANENALPTVISFLGDSLSGVQRRDFAGHGILCARDPADAVRYLSWLYRAANLRPPAVVDVSAATRTPDAAPLAAGWPGAMQLLDEAGIAVPRWEILAETGIGTSAARNLRFPVALKVLPEYAEHKTDAGLLRLNLATANCVDQAARQLREAVGDAKAPLVVQEMVAAGVEVVLSTIADPDFGTVVAIGSGGVLVEVLHDIGYLAAPITEGDVEELLGRLMLSRLLDGFRGAPRADRRALARAALGLARAFAARRHELDEIEINPLIVLPDGHGVIAVDALVRRKPVPVGETGKPHSQVVARA